jgi:hypothetical protein
VVVNGEPEEHQYEPINVVMGDARLRRQVLQRAWKELEEWRRRYEDYEELASVFASMEEVRDGALNIA